MSSTGIVVAMRSEAGCITQHRLPFDQAVSVGGNLVVRVCGMGKEAARRAAIDLCDREKVSGLISFGVAGALNDALQSGDLILPRSVLASRNYSTDTKWHARIRHHLPSHLNITCDPLAASKQMLTTETEKRALAVRTGACAVDMESGAVAAVAAEKGIPFVVIRAIVDPVQFSPPAALMGALRPDGSVKPVSLLVLLLKRSLVLNELMRLAPGMRAARETLKQVVHSARSELSRAN